MLIDFGDRFRRMFDGENDGFLAVSRRGLEAPYFRVTRNSRWDKPVNPWKQSDLLPVLQGGLLSELLYGELPVINNEFKPDPNDPAYEYIQGYRSFMAVPHFHDGEALNLALNFNTKPDAYDPLVFADRILMHNLFGRATNHMVLAKQLREAHEALDREFQVVGDIQRSLLPQALPDIPRLDLASHYQTARRAGGDYFDIFALPDGQFGILLCDVSGHGTPAAVVMAVTHAVAHAYPGPATPPNELLRYLNDKLTNRYDTEGVMFVTAFYGIFNPSDLTLTYAAAGHPPPRMMRQGQVAQLDQAGGIPLGVVDGAEYDDACIELKPGDRLVMFTDGFTEAFDKQRQQYGDARLDTLLEQPTENAAATLRLVLDDIASFTQGTPNDDDQTLLAIHVG
jgi:sigma-B regulation protein RsbU (phosphoserine phosphatase)